MHNSRINILVKGGAGYIQCHAFYLLVDQVYRVT